MAVDIDFRQEGGGLSATWSGDVEVGHLLTMMGNPDRPAIAAKLRYIVMDFSGVDSFPMTMAQVRGLSDATKAATTKGVHRRFAAIVAPKDLGFGQARQWEMFAGDESERDGIFRIFRSRAEAESWIDARMTETYGADSAPFAAEAKHASVTAKD